MGNLELLFRSMYIVILEQGQLHKKAVNENLILFIFLSLKLVQNRLCC